MGDSLGRGNHERPVAHSAFTHLLRVSIRSGALQFSCSTTKRPAGVGLSTSPDGRICDKQLAIHTYGVGAVAPLQLSRCNGLGTSASAQQPLLSGPVAAAPCQQPPPPPPQPPPPPPPPQDEPPPQEEPPPHPPPPWCPPPEPQPAHQLPPEAVPEPPPLPPPEPLREARATRPITPAQITRKTTIPICLTLLSFPRSEAPAPSGARCAAPAPSGAVDRPRRRSSHSFVRG